jgi:hypothetical protein
VGPSCHRDCEKYGAVPNSFRNSRSTVELLHGEISWICGSGAISAELELSQTRPYPKENDLPLPFAPTNIWPLGCLDVGVNVDVDERGRAGPTTNLLQFTTF